MEKLLALFLGFFVCVSHLSAAAADSSALQENLFGRHLEVATQEGVEAPRECFSCGLINTFVQQGNAVGAKGYVNVRCDDLDILEKFVPPYAHVCPINPCLTIRIFMNMSDDVWKIILYQLGRYGVRIYGAEAPFSKHISLVTYLDESPQDAHGEEPISVHWEIDGETVTFL